MQRILLDYYIYRWTCNDIYSISIFYDFLTFFKRNKYWGFLKTIPWVIIMAGTTVYAIDIMLDTNTKIYTDEGGSGYIEGSIFIKELGGASYILASLLGIAMIIVKIGYKAYKNETNDL